MPHRISAKVDDNYKELLLLHISTAFLGQYDNFDYIQDELKKFASKQVFGDTPLFGKISGPSISLKDLQDEQFKKGLIATLNTLGSQKILNLEDVRNVIVIIENESNRLTQGSQQTNSPYACNKM